MHHILGLLYHHALSVPENGFSHSNRGIVDLNAVKLPDGNLTSAIHIHYDLPLVENGKKFFFDSPQRNIFFSQEVAGTVGRIGYHPINDTM